MVAGDGVEQPRFAPRRFLKEKVWRNGLDEVELALCEGGASGRMTRVWGLSAVRRGWSRLLGGAEQETLTEVGRRMARERVLVLYNEPVLPKDHPDQISEVEVL